MTDRRKPGERVSYRPKHDVDDCTKWEFGTVVRPGAKLLTFVIFDGEKHAKACYDSDLFSEFGDD